MVFAAKDVIGEFRFNLCSFYVVSSVTDVCMMFAGAPSHY